MYPDIRPPRARDIRTGALLIAALLVIAAGVFVYDDLERLAVEGPVLVLVAPRASGIEPGAAVWVAGTAAGRITDVQFRDPGEAGSDHLLIRAVLRRDIDQALREDAVAIVRHSALLAPMILSIEPGDPARPPFDYRDTLEVTVPVTREVVMERVDSARARLEALRPLSEALRARMMAGPGTLAALRADSALQEGLRNNLRTLRDLWAAWRGDGSLGRLATDSAVWGSLAAAGARMRTVLGPDAPGHRWLDEESSLALTLRAIHTRLDRLRAAVQAAEGSAGRFRHDAELQEQLQLLRARTDSTRVHLLADPLSWLRFRLF